MPDSRIPAELDVCSDGNNSDHDDTRTPISKDQQDYANNTQQSEFARVYPVARHTQTLFFG